MSYYDYDYLIAKCDNSISQAFLTYFVLQSVASNFITECDRLLLQSASGIIPEVMTGNLCDSHTELSWDISTEKLEKMCGRPHTEKMRQKTCSSPRKRK